MLKSDDQPWSGTESYGFGGDVWSFGCIYFELTEKETFVPNYTLLGSRHCVEWRLGPMPADFCGCQALAGSQGQLAYGSWARTVPWSIARGSRARRGGWRSTGGVLAIC